MRLLLRRFWSPAYGEYHAWPLWSEVTNNSGVTYRYVYWPIRIGLAWRWRAWRTWFTWHGWELPPRRAEPYVIAFGWTFHLGPLKVKFGPHWH